jgi:hypothetical protein
MTHIGHTEPASAHAERIFWRFLSRHARRAFKTDMAGSSGILSARHLAKVARLSKAKSALDTASGVSGRGAP